MTINELLTAKLQHFLRKANKSLSFRFKSQNLRYSRQLYASRLDIELLLAFVLDQPREFLYAHPEYQLTKEQEKNFHNLFKRRINGEPIAYILGRKEFWSLELTINTSVLIPRPETEVLVEVALHLLDNEEAVVADLGTGSGAIALAFAKMRPKWDITATDISSEALDTAQYNAAKLQLKNIEFFCGSWCHALPQKKFDLIVSNPPYIAQKDPHLEQGDVRFEPKIALVAGDGFSEFKKIIVQAKNMLKNSGLLIFEHGYDQREALQILLQQNGYKDVKSYHDLAGIDRVIVAKYES